MRITTVEEYLKDYTIARPDLRQQIHEKFPHVVVVHGYSIETDNATRWCWHQFGPKDGPCYDHYSEYPACPLVLATETIKEGKDHLGNEWKIKEYSKVKEHSHEGSWTVFSLGKVGYDDFIMEFCFSRVSDREAFESEVPNVTLGENYEEKD